MFAKLLDAVKNKDHANDPVTRQMSEAKQENEVAAAKLASTLYSVLDGGADPSNAGRDLKLAKLP